MTTAERTSRHSNADEMPPAATRVHHGHASEAAPLTSALRDFHPGWYGAVMGTAVIAIVAMQNPGGFTGLVASTRVVAQVMTIVAIVLAIGLLIPCLARIVWHLDAASASLRDPVQGGLYGTLPGGILVIAATIAAVGPTWFAPNTVRTVVAALDWVGVPTALAISVVFAYLLFVHPSVNTEAINGSWFIPPVVNIIVPLVFLPLMSGSSPATARALLFMSYAFWGVGFVLYVMVLGMLFQRLIVHPLPHAALAPSLWIGLGPIGVGTVTLVKMVAAGAALYGPVDPSIEVFSNLFATALWGFGAWWLIAATILLVRYLRTGPLPFGIGWWAFTFPLGAYTTATIALAESWDLSALRWLGAGLAVVLTLFWLVVTVRTIIALTVTSRRSALRAPSLPRGAARATAR
ncbi:MAG: SLAC1 family transporter [Acidimicrobiales bacterium]